MSRGRSIDKSSWPGDSANRKFLALLDKIHRENGTRSLRDIAAAMHLRAPSRVSVLLRGKALPADEAQVRSLINALGGGAEDMELGLKRYRAARSSADDSPLTPHASPGRSDAPPGGGTCHADGEAGGLNSRVHRAVVDLPYIHRDVEAEVRVHLDSGRPVLLVGSSMVGKTRIAATVIKEVIGARQLVIPDTKDELVSLHSQGVTIRDSVIFLDDVERLIGAGGITQAALRHLAHQNAVIGTIRALVYDEYQPTDRIRPLEWDVLRIFERVLISRNLSPAEQRRLRKAVDDSDVRKRVLQTGVGEYVGAAERVAEALYIGPSASPAGVALVRGAADWARAGMSVPASASLLAVLAGPHLDARQRLDLADEHVFEDALRWATRSINPTVSLLQREQPDAFSVFDYALDLISGQNEPIPDTTWPVVILHASSEDLLNVGRTASAAGRSDIAEQAWRRAEEADEPETAPVAALFLGAGLSARGDAEGAQAAFEKAIASGHVDAAPAAMFYRGNLLKRQGDLEGAKAAYQHAVGSGHAQVVAVAAVNLGNMLAAQGDVAGARDAYQQAVDSDLDIVKLEADIRTRLAAREPRTRPVHFAMIDACGRRADPEAVAIAALSIGKLSVRQGDAEDARQAFQRAIRSGHLKAAAEAMLELGNLERDQRDIAGARAAFNQAIESGDIDIAAKAAFNLGVMLYQEGDLEGARIAFQRASNSGHPEASPLAAFNLGAVLAETGDVDGARDAYRRAGEAGRADITKDAMGRTLDLGILLAERGDRNGAQAAYQSAVEFGHTYMAPWPMMRLALALIQQGDTETAQAALQSAADSGRPPVIAVASLALGNILADHGDTEAARIALQRAANSGYPEVAAIASLGLGSLLADHGDITAARQAFKHAVHSEHAQIAQAAIQNLRHLP